MRRIIFALALLLSAPLGYAAPLASPYSLAVFPAQSFTASGQTGTVIQLNGLTVSSTVGSSYYSGTITVTGTSLTTATFGVLGSSDNGATYYPLPIINPLAAPSSGVPATTATATANGIYQISLAGLTHVKFVTSGTFTATALSLTLTASPNAGLSQNHGGGSFTPPVGSGRQAYMTPADGSSGAAALRSIASADLPVATGSATGTVKPDGTTCTVDGSGLLTCTGGTGGGGSVGTGPNGAVGGYVNSGTGNGILPLPKLYYINQTMTLSQIQTVFDTADSNSTVVIGNNVPQYQWTNTNGANVSDTRITAMDWSNWFARAGVVCDFRYNLHGDGGYTLTQGSDQLVIGADPYSVGSRMIFAQVLNAGTITALQEVWMPKIISFNSGTLTATLSGPAPFNYSGGAGNGTDNHDALQSILNTVGSTFPIRIPAGCQTFTSLPLSWPGTSIYGVNSASLAGAPGQDIIESTQGEGTVTGTEVHNFNLFLNTKIDSTLGYRLYSDDGSTFTTVQPFYRPVFNNTSNANHPLTDQWSTGANNAVAAITSGSAVICVPNALSRTFTNGQQVIFPYLPPSTNALFNSTISNQTGSGCASGSTGLTLANAMPTLPPANTPIVTTTFNEAGSGNLAGTTPSTCTNGCSGPWTLASGTDWQYQSGGGVQISTNQSSGSTFIGDTITLGVTDFTASWTVSSFDASGFLFFQFRQTDTNNALQFNITNSAINCFDLVAGSGTAVCTPINGSPVGTYTLTLSGANFTLVSPNGTASGTTGQIGTKLMFSTYTGTAGPIKLTSLSVGQPLYNYAQAFFEYGTGFETGETGIGTTLTYPMTVTVNLANAPDPNGTAAAWGHFIIGNNSVRFEADYMGNNYSATPGSGTFVIRKGPATISSALTAGNYFIFPANPCQAMFETPPPVIPNINGASAVTPLGAVDTPGGCVGNAAMAFLEPDGTHPYTGLVNSVIGPVTVSSSDGQANSAASLVEQGNASAYSVSFPGWKIEQTEYGIAQGPTSINNWGVAAVGPTAAGNSFSDCQIHAAFPIVLSDFQQSNINRCDTYTTLISPYDGTAVGAVTAFSGSYTTNEQTGAGVTICSQLWVNNWNSEPENGSHIAIPAYAYVGCSNAVFEESNFEGALSIFNGSNITVKNSQLSLPVINYGYSNKFENDYGMNPFWVTNNWADNSQQFFNWGYLGECSEQSTSGSNGMKTACGSGFYESYSGHSMPQLGLDAKLENEKGGQILPGEMSFFTQFTTGKDSTEPYWQSYIECANIGDNCQEQFFGGNASLFIGQHNRIAPIPYTLEITTKQTTGSATNYQIIIGAFDNGSGTCGSIGQFVTLTVPVTTSWVQESAGTVDFSGKAGCVLQIQVQGMANPVLLGEVNFIPQGHSVTLVPPSDSIYNTACPVNGRQYGVSTTGYSYACVSGTILRTGPFS